MDINPDLYMGPKRLTDHRTDCEVRNIVVIHHVKMDKVSAGCLDWVMDKLDIVLLMSVNPGFGGQSFIPSTLDKLKAVRKKIDHHVKAGGQPILLEVDGGIKVSNVAAAAAAGADTFVVGSAIFGSPDADGGYRGVLSKFRSALLSIPQ